VETGQGTVRRARPPTLIAQIERQVAKRSLYRAADAKHRHRQQPHIAQTAHLQHRIAQRRPIPLCRGPPVAVRPRSCKCPQNTDDDRQHAVEKENVAPAAQQRRKERRADQRAKQKAQRHARRHHAVRHPQPLPRKPDAARLVHIHRRRHREQTCHQYRRGEAGVVAGKRPRRARNTSKQTGDHQHPPGANAVANNAARQAHRNAQQRGRAPNVPYLHQIQRKFSANFLEQDRQRHHRHPHDERVGQCGQHQYVPPVWALRWTGRGWRGRDAQRIRHSRLLRRR